MGDNNMEKELRQFVFNGLLLHDSFKILDKEKGISVTKAGDFQPVSRVVEIDFSPIVWHNACDMASVYQSIFCIENTIRNFIVERMSERYGLDWWNEKVPSKIKNEVIKLKTKEQKNKFFSS